MNEIMNKYAVEMYDGIGVAIVYGEDAPPTCLFRCDTEKDLKQFFQNHKGEYELAVSVLDRFVKENADLFANESEIRQHFKGGDVVG